MKPIRNSAKAIIVEEGLLLTIELADSQGRWYVLPGGGQHHGETLEEALRRECREEVGVEVQVGRLRFIREYIGSKHEFREEDGDSHQVEFMFECRIVKGRPAGLGPIPDTGQLDCVWLPITRIMEFRLYPMLIRQLLENDKSEATSYLGDVN